MWTMQRRQQNILGIDIGRVIIAPGSGRADTSFIDGSEADALCTPATEGAIEAIAQLVEAFGGRVWLVSKCGPRIQRRTLRWLKHNRFHEETGLRRDRVRFCLERRDKREHCATIAATHFVDDRLDVLQNLRDLVPNLFWFAPDPRGQPAPEWAAHARSWDELRHVILDRTG